MSDSSIKDRIEAAFRKARLEKDEKTKQVIGMVKAKLMNELKAGTGAVENDALWLQVLAAYSKELKKSIEQFKTLGEKAAEALAEAEFELAFCDEFLPKKLDEAGTEALVRKIVGDLGLAPDPGGAKHIGRVMGVVMKQHKDDVDGDLVRRIAERVLVSG
jgi:uncharacterized protein YqeY